MTHGFYCACDRFRRRAGGEADWQAMMAAAVPIDQRQFEASCDPRGLLDEDETLETYLAQSGDPETGLFESDIRGHKVFFIQHAGFEMIFTPAGQPLPLAEPEYLAM